MSGALPSPCDRWPLLQRFRASSSTTLAVSAIVVIAAILLRAGEDLQSILPLLGMFTLAAVRLIPSTSRLSSSLAHIRYRYASTEVIYRELLALRQRPSEALPGSAEEQVLPIPFRRSL